MADSSEPRSTDLRGKALIEGPVQSPLDGVRLKLSRAMEHLMTLDDEIAAYRDGEPYTIVREIDPNDRRLRFSFWLTEHPPSHLAVIIGDCVTNLRAALDHLAWQLVLFNGGRPKPGPGGTQFPICESAFTSEGKPRPIKITGGVAPQAFTIIESLQPYHRKHDPSGHPLAMLAELANRDKHQTLHATSLYSNDTTVALVTGSGQRVEGVGVPGPVQHGSVIAIFPFSHEAITTADRDMALESKGTKFIALKDSGPWAAEPITLLLERLHQYVTLTVLGRLGQFFK